MRSDLTRIAQGSSAQFWGGFQPEVTPAVKKNRAIMNINIHSASTMCQGLWKSLSIY